MGNNFPERRNENGKTTPVTTESKRFLATVRSQEESMEASLASRELRRNNYVHHVKIENTYIIWCHVTEIRHAVGFIDS